MKKDEFLEALQQAQASLERQFKREYAALTLLHPNLDGSDVHNRMLERVGFLKKQLAGAKQAIAAYKKQIRRKK